MGLYKRKILEKKRKKPRFRPRKRKIQEKKKENTLAIKKKSKILGKKRKKTSIDQEKEQESFFFLLWIPISDLRPR